ncbi:hypothetical protein [Cryobacterium tagatosivorans]|uniref:Glycosyl transferase n=1 Tax=Cryobacterium tagatosivorans TaxID=1259199 RepID=A0A4R8UEA3_9MICO|nr:hypothetical protein [Cryobacterium tagatosivorans]TFB51748.1 hypothetical protein E3O23_07920 [Cryobacterium tagatosivorans]
MRILQSYPGGRATTNPYLTQLGNRLGARSELLTFTWTRALTDRYDVLHVHWPETLLRGRTPLRALVRRLLFRALLARVRRRRTAVVRTVHNVRSHEDTTPAERRLIERLDRRTTLWIRLNEATPVPGGAPVRTIEHGDYRDWFAGHALPDTQPGRMLYFGLIRSYKGLDALITAFAGLPAAPGAGAEAPSLQIVGRPQPPGLGEAVVRAAAVDTRIDVCLRYVSDAELVDAVGRAELVVLPYREMHNSGAALVALSLGRPILVPSNAVTEALRTEVGQDWVITYSGEISAAVLAEGMARARAQRGETGPDLSRRRWDDVIDRHFEAYESAVLAARSPRPAPRAVPAGLY